MCGGWDLNEPEQDTVLCSNMGDTQRLSWSPTYLSGNMLSTRARCSILLSVGMCMTRNLYKGALLCNVITTSSCAVVRSAEFPRQMYAKRGRMGSRDRSYSTYYVVFKYDNQPYAILVYFEPFSFNLL